MASALMEARIRHGLKERQTAAEFGISHPAYRSWENGRAQPGGQHYPAIQKFLGITEGQMKELVYHDRIAHGNRLALEAKATKARLRKAAKSAPPIRQPPTEGVR